MLGQRRRRWANFGQTLVRRVGFAGNLPTKERMVAMVTVQVDSPESASQNKRRTYEYGDNLAECNSFLNNVAGQA